MANMGEQRHRRIRDPIHGYIFLGREEMELLETAVFGRLRRIKQCSAEYLVYPGLTYSRFEHSLGVCHVITKMFDSLLRNYGEKELEKILKNDMEKCGCDDIMSVRRLLRIAGLVHDIGHPPFSHAGERAISYVMSGGMLNEFKEEYKRYESRYFLAIHEFNTIKLLEEHRELREKIENLIGLSAIKEMLLNTRILKQFIGFESQIDADRMDYLLRDGYYSGAGFGIIDIDRLIADLLIEEGRLCLGYQSLSAAESLIIERYKIYRWVHLHHMCSIVNELVSRTLYHAVEEGLLNPKWLIYASMCNNRRPVYVDDSILYELWREADKGSLTYIYADMLYRRRPPKALWKTLEEADKKIGSVLCEDLMRICTSGFDKVRLLEEEIARKLGMSPQDILIVYSDFKPYKYPPRDGSRTPEIHLYNPRWGGSRKLSELSAIIRELRGHHYAFYTIALRNRDRIIDKLGEKKVMECVRDAIRTVYEQF